MEARGFRMIEIESPSVCFQLPSLHVVLDFPFVQASNDLFEQKDFASILLIRVGQVVEYAHPGVQLLNRLMRELHNTGQLRLRCTSSEAGSSLGIHSAGRQCSLGRFWGCP